MEFRKVLTILLKMAALWHLELMWLCLWNCLCLICWIFVPCVPLIEWKLHQESGSFDDQWSIKLLMSLNIDRYLGSKKVCNRGHDMQVPLFPGSNLCLRKVGQSLFKDRKFSSFPSCSLIFWPLSLKWKNPDPDCPDDWFNTEFWFVPFLWQGHKLLISVLFCSFSKFNIWHWL